VTQHPLPATVATFRIKKRWDNRIKKVEIEQNRTNFKISSK
jgi:hypothetical protein